MGTTSKTIDASSDLSTAAINTCITPVYTNTYTCTYIYTRIYICVHRCMRTWSKTADSSSDSSVSAVSTAIPLKSGDRREPRDGGETETLLPPRMLMGERIETETLAGLQHAAASATWLQHRSATCCRVSIMTATRDCHTWLHRTATRFENMC